MGSSRTAERLLLIEDDDTTREVLALLLSADGWQVLEAASGEAGLAVLVEGSDPQVVLSDLHLPGVEGGRLAKQLRERLPASSVILAMSATTAGATPPGYDALLRKPFGAEEVRSCLRVLNDASAQLEKSVASDLAVLDEETFAALDRQMGGRAGDLYSFALADANSRIERMRSAVKAGDAATFRSEAHGLKGSAGMIGARRLAGYAAEAEAAQKLEKTRANAQVAELEVACAEIRLMLEASLPFQGNTSRAQ